MEGEHDGAKLRLGMKDGADGELETMRPSEKEDNDGPVVVEGTELG